MGATMMRVVTMGLFLGSFCARALAGPGWSSGWDVTLEGAANLRGGASRGAVLHGMALARVAWEQDKTAADRGVRYRAYGSLLALQGPGPAGRLIGDALGTSNIEGSAGVRLYAWWIEANSGPWSCRAGALLADEEFVGTAGGGNQFNSAFGWPAFISANTVNTGPAFSAAAPGVRLERRFGATAAWRLGVFDGDTFDAPDGTALKLARGWRYRLGGGQGSFAISETAFTPGPGALRARLGAWLHTASFDDVSRDAAGRLMADTGAAPRRHPRNGGAYGALERTLAGEPGKPGHVDAFFRAGFSPANRNCLAWTGDAGLAWTGPLPGRPADVATFGIAHAAASARFAAHVRATEPAGAAPDFEQVIEINYRLALSERVSLVPDLQFIRHPGGSAASRDAVLVMLRASVNQ
jgi:porin